MTTGTTFVRGTKFLKLLSSDTFSYTANPKACCCKRAYQAHSSDPRRIPKFKGVARHHNEGIPAASEEREESEKERYIVPWQKEK